MTIAYRPVVESRGTRRQCALDRIADVPYWWHSIDLGDDVVTPGQKSPELLAEELAALDLPSLAGRSVLDVGAWDGFYSFVAESRGAQRVVALDRFVWALDHPATRAFRDRYRADGRPTPPYDTVPELWDVSLPGKQGFDLCHELLNSSVETVIGTIHTVDPATLGMFDVVLYLGVLYHETNPFEALLRLRALSRDLVVLESEMTFVPGRDDIPAALFFPGEECNGDPTNWWSPNQACLVGMALAAGFVSVECKRGPDPAWSLLPADHPHIQYRGIYHVHVR